MEASTLDNLIDRDAGRQTARRAARLAGMEGILEPSYLLAASLMPSPVFLTPFAESLATTLVP
jgi:hypothetical protein